MGAAALGTQRGFPFQKKVLGAGSREEINLSMETNVLALKAIRDNQPFPVGADGTLALGGIQFDWNSSGPVRFAAPGGDLDLEITAGGHSGGGIYGQADPAFQAAGLVEGFSLPESKNEQFLVLTTGYKAAGTLSPSYPLGAFLTAGVDWSGSREGATAVVRRIAKNSPAFQALSEATGAWRLPRQIDNAADLPPGTWVAARGSGSLSVQLSARAGYTVYLLREISLLGMSRNLNARLAAALTATAGVSLKDEYVIVAGRESDEPVIRLRIFRAAKRSNSVGLDLTVGLKVGKPASRAGSFVNLMLGIHGLQVLGDLKALRQWKGQMGGLEQTPARLDDQTTAALLTAASGSTVPAKLEEARDLVAGALDKWSALPPKVRAALWESLEDAAGNTALPAFLKKLANADAAGAAAAISDAIAADPGQQSAELLWLTSVTENGSVLPLLENPEQVREPAVQSLTVLDEGILARLKKFIESQLDLGPLTAADGPEGFAKLNKWLLARLSDFLDRSVALGDLAELKLAIAGLQKAEPNVAAKAQSAFAQLLRLNVSATYERASRKTALLDASFNLDRPEASQVFRDLMDKGQLDRVITEKIEGVTLHAATLTHELARTAEIQLHLPFFDSKRESVNETIAKLEVEESAGRVLTYQLDSKDRAAASGRFRSELSILSRASVEDGKLDLSGLAGATLAYQSRQVQRSANLADLRLRTATFLRDRIAGELQRSEARAAMYDDLVFHAGGNSRKLGDIALQFEVSLPGTALSGWLRERTDDERRHAALAVSKALGRGLKELIPQIYLADDLSRLQANDTVAALLVWASIPPFDGPANGLWKGAKNGFWNYPDANLRNAVLRDSQTVANLQRSMAEAAERWREAGDNRQADYFAPGQAGGLLQKAAASPLLQSLLFTEARMVRGAAKALDDLRDCWRNATTAPSETLRALAEFGSDLSSTFNKKLSVFSSPEALRTFNSFLLTEASAALAPDLAVKARAAVTLFFLRDGHELKADEFLEGAAPPADQIRFARVFLNSPA